MRARELFEVTKSARQKLDFDKLYGKAFKVVDNSGDPSLPGFSIVTPSNSNAWTDWRERPEFKKIVKQKLNDPNFLGDHKYQQIIDAIRKMQVAEATKVKISTSKKEMGAWVDNREQDEPTAMIDLKSIISVLEPDELHDTKPGAKKRVDDMVKQLEKGKDTPPVLVRKYKSGYQILDGHHRFKAYKKANKEQIPAIIVAAKNITDVTDRVERGENIDEVD